MRRLAVALLALVALVRADFVPPADGPVPFRRDKLPVDVETITALSRQITTLTGADLPKDATGLRSAAQMTALALALDPANREARDLIEHLRQGGTPEAADEKELQRSRSRSWQVLGWLEMPEAGADGQALAACLGDILVIADPEHPKAELRSEEGEKGAWQDWVAPISAFEKKPDPEPEPQSEPEEEKQSLPSVALASPSAPAAIWVTDQATKKTMLKFTQVRAKVTAGSESGRIDLSWGKLESPPPSLVAAALSINSVVAKRHDGLEGGLQANFRWDGDNRYAPEKNGAILTGSAVTLLDAAMSGEPTQALAFAEVAEDGSLKLPHDFWSSLRQLTKLEGSHRIIFPAKAEEFLSALLVLGDFSFFMNNEVLLASTADELCDLAAGKPKPAIAEGFAAFEEIRKAGLGKSLGSFLAHPSTLARLNKLAASMPHHASARLLALQGSGNRPRFLPRAILAREIRSALQPVQYVNEATVYNLLSQRLDDIHSESRKKLDDLYTVVEIRDRDIHKSAVSLADSLRTLARLLDKKDDSYTLDLRDKQEALQRSTWTEYVRVFKLLSEIAGDGADFAAPKPFGDR